VGCWGRILRLCCMLVLSLGSSALACNIVMHAHKRIVQGRRPFSKDAQNDAIPVRWEMSLASSGAQAQDACL